MAVLPMYQQRTEANGLPAANPTPGAFGARTAQAAAGLGSALENIGAAENQALRYQELNSARSWAGNAISKATLDWTKDLQDRQQKAEPGAPGFAPKVIEDFDSYAAKTLANAPDDMSKRFLEQHFSALRTQIGTQALTFQAHQQVAYNVELATQSIDNWSQSVLQDASKYGIAKQAIGETAPYPGAIESQKLQDRARKELTNAAATNQLQNDPYELRNQTAAAIGEQGYKVDKAAPWIADATPEQIKSWRQAAEVRIKQLEADANRGKEQDAQVALKEVQGLREFVTQGLMPDPDYTARVREVTAQFPDLRAAVDDYLDQAVKGAGFGSYSLPNQQALLTAEQGKPTNPERQKVLKLMQDVNAQQTAAAKADPWEAGSKYWRLPEAQLQNITDPLSLLGTVAARNAQATALETATGFPVSPLRPQEAKQAADMLARMPIPDRTNVLGQIGKTLPPDRLNALAEQLGARDKVLELSLKLGADVTTAGRMTSELVALGAQGLADKAIKKDDTALAGWRAEIADLVRGTLGDPRAEQDIIDAAYYVRAAQELDAAKAPGFTRGFGSGAADAIKLVVGTPLERSGVKTLLPRGMTETDFDARARSALSAYAGQRVYLRGQPMPAEALASRWDSYGVRMVRPGEYVPVSNNAQFTTDPAGTRPLRIKVQ